MSGVIYGDGRFLQSDNSGREFVKFCLYFLEYPVIDCHGNRLSVITNLPILVSVLALKYNARASQLFLLLLQCGI